jgi:uncharacterized protein
MTNPVLAVFDWWSRRYVPKPQRRASLSTMPATVITGASEGIGRALARRFAEAGDRVVLVARREALLQTVADEIRRDFKADPVVLPIDVNRPDAAGEIECALQVRGLHVDVLINNAGFGVSGEFASLPEADIEALISCNIAALTRLSRHFLPAMLERNRGGLINIASLAGLTPGPYQAPYYASKAYVISLTRAIAYEIEGSGVKAMVVTPGPVETGFHARMNAETSFYRYFVPSPSAEMVAAATYYGFKWHFSIIAPGMSAKVMSVIMRLVPKYLVIPATGWLLYPRLDERAADDGRLGPKSDH